MLAEFTRWRGGSNPLFIRFDLSVFETSLSALCDRPRLGGCDLETVAQWLGVLGQQQVITIMLTGLNPSRAGMTTPLTTFQPPLSQLGFRLFEGPAGDIAKADAGQIGVVGMPSDWTHSNRLGTRFGPAALRKAGL